MHFYNNSTGLHNPLHLSLNFESRAQSFTPFAYLTVYQWLFLLPRPFWRLAMLGRSYSSHTDRGSIPYTFHITLWLFERLSITTRPVGYTWPSSARCSEVSMKVWIVISDLLSDWFIRIITFGKQSWHCADALDWTDLKPKDSERKVLRIGPSLWVPSAAQFFPPFRRILFWLSYFSKHQGPQCNHDQEGDWPLT